MSLSVSVTFLISLYPYFLSHLFPSSSLPYFLSFFSLIYFPFYASNLLFPPFFIRLFYVLCEQTGAGLSILERGRSCCSVDSVHGSGSHDSLAPHPCNTVCSSPQVRPDVVGKVGPGLITARLKRSQKSVVKDTTCMPHPSTTTCLPAPITYIS
jgi:hypothetical protein